MIFIASQNFIEIEEEWSLYFRDVIKNLTFDIIESYEFLITL